MTRTLAIARRVTTELLRDKRTLALMFLAPILILLLMKAIFGATATTDIRVATVNVPQAITTTLADNKHVVVHHDLTAKDAKHQLSDQKVDAVLTRAGDTYTLRHANVDASKTKAAQQLTAAALQKAGVTHLKAAVVKQQAVIQQLTGQLARLTGRPVPAQPAAKADTTTLKQTYAYGDKDTNFFDKILPILMGFFVFFFVFLISGMALLRERTTGTLDRLLATPVRRGEIVAGYMLAYGGLAVAQTLLIVLMTVYVLGVTITGSILAVVAVNVLLALVALAFGLLLSTFARSEFQMMQFIPLVVVPQVFFSGIIPLDSMADWVQKIAYVLPLKYSGDAQSQIILHGQSLWAQGGSLAILALFLVVLTGLNVMGLKRYRKV